MGQIAYFSLRMRKTALFLLPVKNLTSPSYSPTPISYNTRGNFGDSVINTGQIAYFSLRMRETPIILYPVKHLTPPSCPPTPIYYIMQEFLRFGHKYGPNCIFFIAHAQNGLISTSCQKSDVTVVFPDPDFLQRPAREFWRYVNI